MTTELWVSENVYLKCQVCVQNQFIV